MKSNKSLKLDNQLCFTIYAASREITKIYRPYLDVLGLTYTQYITMMVLWETYEISVKELGKRLLLDSGTLTPLLKKLVKMGLITKRRDPYDERLVLVTLTEDGLSLKEKALEIPEKIFCHTQFTVEEIHHLKQILTQLMENLQSSHK